MLLSAGLCFAQSSSNFQAGFVQRSCAQYPQVDSNSRVQIRFKALDATKLRGTNCCAIPIPPVGANRSPQSTRWYSASPRCAPAGGTRRNTGRSIAAPVERFSERRFRGAAVRADECRGAPGCRLRRNGPYRGKTPDALLPGTLLCSLAKLMREALQQSDNCAVRGRGRRHI